MTMLDIKSIKDIFCAHSLQIVIEFLWLNDYFMTVCFKYLPSVIADWEYSVVKKTIIPRGLWRHMDFCEKFFNVAYSLKPEFDKL